MKRKKFVTWNMETRVKGWEWKERLHPCYCYC